MTTFYVVRHGQTWANRAGKKQGILDTAETTLTPRGMLQARQLRAAFPVAEMAGIICSPLQRARQTAGILNEFAQRPVEISPEIVELSYGAWNGCMTRDLMARYPAAFDARTQEVTATYTRTVAGESMAAVRQRIQQFVRKTVTARPNDKLLIVGHGWTVKMLLLLALNGDNGAGMVDPVNASVTRIEVDPSTLRCYLDYYNRGLETGF